MIMQIIDEECVDKAEIRRGIEHEKANNVKDGIREGPIVKICGLFS
jgi:hypothetical protein